MTSTALDAFVGALNLVAGNRPTGAEATRRPAVNYVPPGVDRNGMALDDDGAGDAAGAGGGPAPGGGEIAAARRQMANGTLSAAELVEQSIVAAEKRGFALGAVVELLADQARAEAVHFDRLAATGAPMGPLHGIPITVKDVIHVAGVPTRAGSDAYRVVPETDAVAVARARAAGAIVIAKVSTHEFALGVTTPQSANPFDDRRIPGGSSGGSAIAVACGIGLASIGTDTRASIRVPAALCGVVGLKGTYGLVPTEGIVSLSWTMDHVAPIGATVADAALLLEVMAGHTIASGRGRPAAIGVLAAGFEDCETAVATTAMAAAQRLMGASPDPDRRMVELDRPDNRDLDLANAVGLIVSRCEAAAFHRSLFLDRSSYWDEVRDQLDAADEVPATDYLDAQRLRGQIVGRLHEVFRRCDVLCLPTVGVQPPLRGDFTRFLTVLSRACVPWSLAGFPAVTVPCGFDSDGFPVGLQIVGPPGADGLVVAAAAAVERSPTV